ncbi:DUF5337 domain-containing protein [Sulfitobacter sabulilitoris]|uniref:DUF5337 domain-containing protein n=1 Tax=Sulfitobacter sabulilitoris TaxID=2562655 RepID=A0A5S3PKJ6_9RHOB|nr:DUF5337 domain-containing protein [Sulfitobacter sabulilitoris]TMM54948.1 hypothetical protein FDT80_05055 [Sulfitobacter sabulilitoris]
MTDEEQDRQLAARSRMVSLVIAGTMILWLVLQVVAPQLGLPGRYALLFDFAALAALFWALVVSFQIRRARKALRSKT